MNSLPRLKCSELSFANMSAMVKALVPRVIGQSEAAREQKARSSPARSGAPSVRLNREIFLSSCPPESCEFFTKVLDEAEKRGLQVRPVGVRELFSSQKRTTSGLLSL